MKFISASVTNFASYRSLQHFTFTDQGLTLISGPTGSGKSTLCDIIPWILFGRTAKGGTVDEIRTWNTEEPTDGTLVFNQGGTSYYVRRIRGNKANDLFYGFYTDYITEGKRGKDLNDTQKKINQIVGIDAETYLAGAYFHEFSQTAQFFTTTAKVRRSITEQLADLTLAKQLQENASAYTKELKKEVETLTQEITLKKHTLATAQKARSQAVDRWNDYEESYAKRRQDVIDKMKNFNTAKAKEVKVLSGKSKVFEKDREAKIADIMAEIKEYEIKPDSYYESSKEALTARIAKLRADTCKECGAPKSTDSLLVAEKELYGIDRDIRQNKEACREVARLTTRVASTQAQVNPYEAQIAQEKTRVNTYSEQLEELNQSTNPHTSTLDATLETIELATAELKALEVRSLELVSDKDDIETLSDILDTFRSTVISRTVSYLETSTNDLLNAHFDAEIRVAFQVSDADKLEVEITKDGNICSYTQLSKGQRGLLKLCFGASVLKSISMYNAVDFNCLWFDESLDGFSDELRAKAFTLFEKLALSHESVYVVDHSEAFKSLFSNRINVHLVDGGSEIEQD